MEEKQISIERRVRDPYVDRRSGESRRQAYDTFYWDCRGVERRSAKDRRQPKERRDGWVKVSNWSSVCPNNNKADQ